ncbi:nucleoid occlusion protein [Deinococcus xinjiangensis]|uniref:Nucleoid occlusion protein n=1 Tax=Deinococcus xinjiangensis TaxID=457454 RepID=A0ABP9VGV9_9DEIO
MTATEPTKARKASKKAAAPQAQPASARTPSTFSYGDLVRFTTCENGTLEGHEGRVNGFGSGARYFICVVESGTTMAMIKDGEPYHVWAHASDMELLQAAEQDNPFPVTETEIDATTASAQPSTIEQTIVESLGLPSTSFVAALGAARRAESEIAETPTLGTELASGEPLTAEISAEQPSGSNIAMFTLDQLYNWPAQPRREFEQTSIDELAESVFHKGLMQNLVGRAAADGRVEVIAGGRRLRALTQLAAAGRIDRSAYFIPVSVQVLSDLEALQLSTAENVERKNMTPLEEADAFARMVELGAAPEDIALKFGYSAKVVDQRLTLAKGLGDDGRKLYQQGKIGLGQAQVIAQTSGPLRKHVVDAAKSGDSVGTLTSLVKKHAFLVEHAKSDVEKSGLEVVPDLYGSTPPHFADPKAALVKQLDWIATRKQELEGKKKEHLFVEVLKQTGSYLRVPYDAYDEYNPPKELRGTVIAINTDTGEVKEVRCARRADVEAENRKKQAAERKKTTAEATGGEEGGAIRKQAFVDGHKARATALRQALLGDHKRTVALGILTLLSANPVPFRVSFQDVQAAPNPAGMKRVQELDKKLGGALKANKQPEVKNPLGIHFSYGNEGTAEYVLLEKLLTLSLEELLDLHGVLIAQGVGGWSDYNPQHAPYSFVTRLASDVGAQVSIKLTDDHLKAYPKDRLLELARDAGLEYIANNVAKYPTNTALRGAILEMADELHAKGYVPPICRFPEPDPAALAQEQADQQYRVDALALIPRLNDEQVKELSADMWEVDEAENTDVDELRTDLLNEIEDLDIDELREWEALSKLAKEIGPIEAAD